MKVRALVLGFAVLAVAPARAVQQPAASTAPRQAPRASTPAPPAAPAAPAQPAAPAPPPPTRRVGQPVNIKVEVTITDQTGGAAPALKKTVSVTTGDLMNGFIRSNAYYQELGPVPLNVDTEPELLADGKIRLRVNLQYDLPNTSRSGEAPGAGPLRKTELRENLALILENGKPIVAAQSADPVGDRQVTIEVKATILR